MKNVAMYLPQFYEVPENDEWWGEGFTDWVSTKAAKPLFEGHYQPHIPKDGYYYNLIEKKALLWQADLMYRYGIDGVCIYHYWFKDGRQILEKPAENLLKWKDVDMSFCFCWANETWARSWSNVKNSITWTDIDENKDSSSDGILLEQGYGSEEDWEEHFYYLLPFFKDMRYIRIDDKPVFVIYKVNHISCIHEMLRLWNDLALRNGLKGLYVIGSHIDSSVSLIDAELFHEPIRSRRQFLDFEQNDGVNQLDYDKVWNMILKTKKSDYKTYYGGFCGYDDTPRRGARGMVVLGQTPEKFCSYLTQLIAKNAAEENCITFINAWNEWGEGMHLEPDEKYGYRYLEAVKTAKQNYPSYISRYKNEDVDSGEMMFWKKRSDKFERYLNLLDEWMTLKEKGYKISREIEKRWNKVLVYGYGIFARHLLKELESSNVKVVGVVDKRKPNISESCPVYSPYELLPDSDCIIVTSFFYYDEITKGFDEYKKRIISIEQLIRGVEG